MQIAGLVSFKPLSYFINVFLMPIALIMLITGLMMAFVKGSDLCPLLKGEAYRGFNLKTCQIRLMAKQLYTKDINNAKQV